MVQDSGLWMTRLSLQVQPGMAWIQGAEAGAGRHSTSRPGEEFLFMDATMHAVEQD